MDAPQWVITPMLMQDLLLAKQRYDAGITSGLEAGIEQLEAMLLACPFRYGQQLVDALKAYNDGDDTALNYMLRPVDTNAAA